jgi:hypothetical protein
MVPHLPDMWVSLALITVILSAIISSSRGGALRINERAMRGRVLVADLITGAVW